MKYLTAGESHGKALVGILEGLPSNVPVRADNINRDLKRRQAGYGRGARMQIESDQVELLSGIRGGFSTGAPIAVMIANRDYENWKTVMDSQDADLSARAVTCPRPGHADWVGAKKFQTDDCRNILERASARNTASTVALGGVAKEFLSAIGVEIVSYVTAIGRESDDIDYDFDQIKTVADTSPVRAMADAVGKAMMAEIDRAKAASDTVGGSFRVIVRGVKPGVGSCMEQAGRLDASLSAALMGLQGIKAVEVGAGHRFAEAFGTEIHDAMYPKKGGGVLRKTNRAGGIEGGMSNGEDIVISAVFKAIPTTMKGLPTVNLLTGQAAGSSKERSDICAVPAASVVAESLVALTLADEILKYTGGSALCEVQKRWN